MGPDRNNELFEAAAASRIESLTGEFVRRNLLATTLKELSDLFEEKDSTSHPVTEPTLIGRLWALTQVQRSHMGIAGFEPLDAVRYDRTTSAKSAPHHDEFIDNNGNAIRTRIISLTMEDTDDIEVFGLNLYQPDGSTDEFFEDYASKKLVMVSGEGKVKEKIYPITGETAIFAVRNKQTQDAKLYKVRYIELSVGVGAGEQSIHHETEQRAIIRLPDDQMTEVELLGGELQQQVVDELELAIRKLRDKAHDSLSTEELHAVSGILDGGQTPAHII